MRTGGFQACGSNGIPEWPRRTPWRLRGFAAYPVRVPGRFRALEKRSDAGFRGGKGICRPCRGWFSMGGTEPSAYALGYHLSALRAWGHGFGGREAAEVHRDLTRFFLLSFRYRCRSRYRRVGRGFAGRVARMPGVLVSFVVEQRRRVEPRSAQRARNEDGKDRAMWELSEQAGHNHVVVG
jgi:hypothetical protein